MKQAFLLMCVLALLIPGMALAQDEGADGQTFDNGIVSGDVPAEWFLTEDEYAGAFAAATTEAALNRFEDQPDGIRGTPIPGDMAVVMIAIPNEFLSLLSSELDLGDPMNLARDMKVTFLQQDFLPEDFNVSEPQAVTLGEHEYWETSATMPGREELTLIRVEGDVVIMVVGNTAPGEQANVQPFAYQLAESANVYQASQTLYQFMLGNLETAFFETGGAAALPQNFDNGILSLNYPQDWSLLPDDDYAGRLYLASPWAMIRQELTAEDFSAGMPLEGEFTITVQAYNPEIQIIFGGAVLTLDDPLQLATDFVATSTEELYDPETMQVGMPSLIELGGETFAEVKVTLPQREDLYLVRHDDGTIIFLIMTARPVQFEFGRTIALGVAESMNVQQSSETLYGIMVGDIDPLEFHPEGEMLALARDAETLWTALFNGDVEAINEVICQRNQVTEENFAGVTFPTLDSVTCRPEDDVIVCNVVIDQDGKLVGSIQRGTAEDGKICDFG